MKARDWCACALVTLLLAGGALRAAEVEAEAEAAGAVEAEPAEPNTPPRPVRVDAYLDVVSRRLELTPEQRSLLRPILEEHFTEERALRQKGLASTDRQSFNDMRTHLGQLQVATDDRLAEVLTAAQMQELRNMRKSDQERRRRIHRPPPPPPRKR